jgi:hypothetical protein
MPARFPRQRVTRADLALSLLALLATGLWVVLARWYSL